VTPVPISTGSSSLRPSEWLAERKSITKEEGEGEKKPKRVKCLVLNKLGEEEQESEEGGKALIRAVGMTRRSRSSNETELRYSCKLKGRNHIEKRKRRGEGRNVLQKNSLLRRTSTASLVDGKNQGTF